MESVEGKTTDIRTIIILLNGFLKKSTKDYDKQIAKAVGILKDLVL